jgi:predicted transcriptional regulator
MKAARALLDMDQRLLSELSGVSLATIRRMEASTGTVRSNVDTLVKIVETLEREGVLLIAEGADSFGGGRGVRLRG